MFMPCSEILPNTLARDMSALERRTRIATAALLVPEDKRTAWDLWCASCALNAQSKGVIAERIVQHVMGGDGIRASDDKGDFVVDDVHYEVKSSFVPGRINVRQIRPWQDVSYLIVHVNVEDKEDCQCFRLTHEQMMAEIREIGCVTHGTKRASEVNVNREYSVSLNSRPKRKSKTAERWALYRDPILEALLF